MNFVDHTARLAAEQIANGKPLEDIEEVELDSLQAKISAELQDRGRRVAEYAEELPF